MLSITNYKDYDCSHHNAIIAELLEGPRTTSDLMKIRCKGKRMACVSTYVSRARKKVAKAGSTLVCNKTGRIGNEIFTYSII